MQISWHIICSRKSLLWIESVFQGREMQIKPYWKDSDCLELNCSYESDTAEEAQLTELCRQISGTDRVWIDRQPIGTEYACYVSLEEIKNGEKAFAVCFVNIKENGL